MYRPLHILRRRKTYNLVPSVNEILRKVYNSKLLVVLFVVGVLVYDVVQGSSVNEILKCDHSMKTIEQYFQVV